MSPKEKAIGDGHHQSVREMKIRSEESMAKKISERKPLQTSSVTMIPYRKYPCDFFVIQLSGVRLPDFFVIQLPLVGLFNVFLIKLSLLHLSSFI